LGGARPLAQDGRGALQELPQTDLLVPITKWQGICRDVERVGEYVVTAYRYAMAQPRGPVYLELPMDVLFATVSGDEAQRPPVGGVNESRAFGDPRQILRAAALLNESERPLVIAGSGVYWDGGERQLRLAVESGDLPVVMNGMGRGLLPPDHPLAFALARRAALA